MAFTAGMFFKFWGVTLLMMHYVLKNVQHHWEDELIAPTLEAAMSYNTYKIIKGCMEFGQYAPHEEGFRDNDPFQLARKLFDLVNLQICIIYIVGTLLTGDESMAQWSQLSCPGALTIERKPIPLGFEFWTMCDALSRVLVFFELHEDMAGERRKELLLRSTGRLINQGCPERWQLQVCPDARCPSFADDKEVLGVRPIDHHRRWLWFNNCSSALVHFRNVRLRERQALAHPAALGAQPAARPRTYCERRQHEVRYTAVSRMPDCKLLMPLLAGC